MKDLEINALINQQMIPLAENKATGAYELISTAPYTLYDMNLPIDIIAKDTAGNTSTKFIKLKISNVWVTPKIDWTVDDYFNIEDWRRIMGNMLYNYNLSLKMYPLYTIGEMTGVRSYEHFPTANDFNELCRNLEIIIKRTFSFPFVPLRIFKDNEKYIDYSELNHIESTSLEIYEYLISQYENLKILPFTLGGDEFGD